MQHPQLPAGFGRTVEQQYGALDERPPRLNDIDRFWLSVCGWIVACALAVAPVAIVAALTGRIELLAAAAALGTTLFYLVIAATGRWIRGL